VDTPLLRAALQRYPEADADRDGVLTEAEARAYRAAHPDAMPAVPPAPVATATNVAYGPYPRNVLDFWKADSAKPTPLVVFIHGGGFQAGDKSNASAGDIARCLREGVSYAAINYRFRTTAALPDILRDIARAVQFLRSKAGEWNLDPARVAAYGGSAGAGSALWLAFHDDLADPASADPVLRQSTRLVAAAGMGAQATYDLSRWPEVLGMDPDLVYARVKAGHGDLFREQDLASQAPAAVALRRSVDMLGFLSADDPPVCLISGGADVVPGDIIHHPRHAKAVKKRCDELGVEAVLVVDDTPPAQRVSAIEFLLRRLKAK
jgi:acetyl esterase/lipase